MIEGKMLQRILTALEVEFGSIETTDVGAALRLTSLDVDLIRSDTHALFKAALDRGHDRSGARVPPPELLVA